MNKRKQALPIILIQIEHNYMVYLRPLPILNLHIFAFQKPYHQIIYLVLCCHIYFLQSFSPSLFYYLNINAFKSLQVGQLFTKIYYIFNLQSMLRESSSLTNHSLESFINEATHSSQAFYLHELLEHPKLDTISQAHRKILELFIYGTYLTWNSAEIGLDKNQIHQLKRITILQMMDGKQEIQINEIISKLELSKIEVYKILTQMNIQGVISIKINQKTGKCAILSAHSRLKSGLDERIPQFQAKLQKIYAKNKDYLGVLNKAGDSSKKRKFLFEQDD